MQIDIIRQGVRNILSRRDIFDENLTIELAAFASALSGDSTPTDAVCGLCGKSGEHLGREQKTCWIGAAALSGDTEPPKPGMAQCIFVWGDERCGLAPHHEGWHVGASLTWKGIHGPVYPLQGYLRAASSPEGTP